MVQRDDGLQRTVGGVSRRGLMQGGLAFGCLAALPRAIAGGSGDGAVAIPSHRQVQLLAGPLLVQREHQKALYMGLEVDRLLKPFRARAGLPAPGDDMGGWYDDSRDFHIDPHDWSSANWHGYIPGHSFGQYLSGLSRIHAATGEAAIAERVTELVRGYRPTIGAAFFDDYNLPAYTYNKLLEGLIDAYRYAGVDEARAALDVLTDAVLPFLPEKALTREERRQRPYSREAQIWDEPYVLPENLFRAWELGMGQRYHALALRFLQDDAFFTPLAAGISPLAGRHAYSHVNALNSAIEAWRATGQSRYLHAARNGFDFVLAQSYATGGWGPNEELIGPDDATTLADSLRSTHRSFETPCGAHAHFKIARSLLTITGQGRYGDSMERVLYNTILGALPTSAEGDTFYYSDYHQHARKGFRGEAWPCCSGTFVQLVADYGISSWLVGPRTIQVNLYAPSRLSARMQGSDIVLEQSTEYPDVPRTRIRIERGSGRFELALRLPAWAGAKTSIMVNGRAQRYTPPSDGFVRLERRWREGDSVEVAFDMELRLEALDRHHPDLVALMYGPLVLMPVEAGERQAPRSAWLDARREGRDRWLVQGEDGPIELRPFMAIDEPQAYRIYNLVEPLRG